MMPDAWQQVWAAARDGDLQRHGDAIHHGKSPIDTKPCVRSGQAGMQVPLRVLVCQVPKAGQVSPPVPVHAGLLHPLGHPIVVHSLSDCCGSVLWRGLLCTLCALFVHSLSDCCGSVLWRGLLCTLCALFVPASVCSRPRPLERAVRVQRSVAGAVQGAVLLEACCGREA